jgi:hypothetical protein
MSIPPESIEAGKCYLARSYNSRREGYPRVRRVTEILLDDRVRFEQRRGPVAPGRLWPGRYTMKLRGPVAPGRLWPGRYTMKLEAFANSAEREVRCDWTPERDGA